MVHVGVGGLQQLLDLAQQPLCLPIVCVHSRRLSIVNDLPREIQQTPVVHSLVEAGRSRPAAIGWVAP